MRRNIKVLLLLCISWIFVVVYYLQTATVTKVPRRITMDCHRVPGLCPSVPKGENRALRLKEGVTPPSQYDEVGLVPGAQLALQGSAETTDGRLTWNYFDEEGYVSRAGLRQGEDPYIRNRFNQEASDNLPSNREIPDTRNPM